MSLFGGGTAPTISLFKAPSKTQPNETPYIFLVLFSNWHGNVAFHCATDTVGCNPITFHPS